MNYLFFNIALTNSEHCKYKLSYNKNSTFVKKNYFYYTPFNFVITSILYFYAPQKNNTTSCATRILRNIDNG